MALEVLKCSVAHKVTVLTVLGRAESPTGALEGVVLHGNDMHDGGNEVPDGEIPGVFIPA
jgi:hypothetical protein